MRKEIKKTKKCSKCGEAKGLDEYYKHPHAKYGVGAQCKDCDKARKQTPEYRAWNKEWQRRYHQTPEYKARAKAHYQTPEYRARNKEWQRRYRKTPKYKVYEKARKQTPEYKEAQRKARQRHRAKMRGVESDSRWNMEVRRGVYKAQFESCYYSGKPITFENAHIEHFYAIANGGTDTIDNIVLADGEINKRKGTKCPYQFIEELEAEGIVHPNREEVDIRLALFRESVKNAQTLLLGKQIEESGW